MNALITGGAGFIGSNLVRGLARGGHRITVLDDLSSGRCCNLSGLAIRFIEGDVRDPDAVAEAMREIDVVFHLAASVGNKRSIDCAVRDAEVNVIGTVRLLEAARRAGVRKFVTSSSAGIFGELKTVPIGEDHTVDPDTPYGASKLCAEKETLAYGKLYGMETVCLRYFNVYGPNQRFDAYGNVIPIFVFRMLRGEKLTIFGDGEQTRDFVNVSDVVQANLRAAAAARVRGAFNIGSGSRVTINELMRRLKAASGLEPEVDYAPPRPGDVRDSMADIAAARQAFGFAPSVGLDEGLNGYIAWARQEVARHAA
jgi:UDP-glucose 4-epimerase